MAPSKPTTRSTKQSRQSDAAPTHAESSVAQQAAHWLAASRQRILLLLLVGGGFFVLYCIIFGRDGVAAFLQKRREAQQLQQQMQTLQQENQQMTLQNQRLLNDPNAIEDAARRQLHYTRPGEVIYTLPEAPGAQDEAAQKPVK